MKYKLLIILVVVLHLNWGLTLFVFNLPYHTTGLSALIVLFGNSFFAGAFILAACVLAVVGLYKEDNHNTVFFMLPQQFILLVTSGAVLHAVVVSAFPDGVVRPRLFIWNDQLHLILLSWFHTVAILEPKFRQFRQRRKV